MNTLKMVIDGLEITLDDTNIEACASGPYPIDEKDKVKFANLCFSKGLNPFSSEIWMIKNNPDKPAQITVGKDGYLVLANRDKRYKGCKSGIIVRPMNKTGEKPEYREGAFWIQNEEQLLGGWASVDVEGLTTDVIAAIPFSDYYDANSYFWRRMASTMLEKTALSQALKKAFPSTYSGMYMEGELPEENDQLTTQKTLKTSEPQKESSESPVTPVSQETPETPVSQETPESHVSQETPQKKEKLKYKKVKAKEQEPSETNDSPQVTSTEEHVNDRVSEQTAPKETITMEPTTAADPVKKPEKLTEVPLIKLEDALSCRSSSGKIISFLVSGGVATKKRATEWLSKKVLPVSDKSDAMKTASSFKTVYHAVKDLDDDQYGDFLKKYEYLIK